MLGGALRSGAPPATPGAVGAAEAALFPPGSVSVYALRFHSLNAARIATSKENAVAVDAHLEGLLELRSYETQDLSAKEKGASSGNGALLGFRLSRVDAVALNALFAASDVALTEELLTADALVRFDSTGSVDDVRFSPQTSLRAKRFLRGVYLELGAQLATSRASTSRVETALGRAQVTTETKGDKRVSTRTSYDSLEAFPNGFEPAKPTLSAHGEVHLGQENELLSASSEEDIKLVGVEGLLTGYQARTTVSVERTTHEVRILGAPPDYPESAGIRDMGDLAFDRHASLVRRAAGVTLESVLDDATMAAAAPKSGLTEWVWHDSAYLELHPEEIPKVLAAKASNEDARRTTFDLACIVGTPEAQSALVRELSLGKFRNADEKHLLYQRLSYLREPTPETTAFLSTTYGKNRRTLFGLAAAHALGALAAAVAKTDEAEARRLVAPLVADLASAKTAEERAALVRSLGNAGLSGTQDAMVVYRKDKDPTLRMAVARGLRRITGEGVAPALLELAADQDPMVAQEAMSSLFRRNLEEKDWAALATLLQADAVPRHAQGTLVSGLAEHRQDSPKVTEILVSLLASPTLDEKIRNQVQGVLQPL